MSAEDTLPYQQNISASLAARRKSRDNLKDVDVVMAKARASVASPASRPHMSAEKIPTSYSGTWSNSMANGPRSTILKVTIFAAYLYLFFWSLSTA